MASLAKQSLFENGKKYPIPITLVTGELELRAFLRDEALTKCQSFFTSLLCLSVCLSDGFGQQRISLELMCRRKLSSVRIIVPSQWRREKRTLAKSTSSAVSVYPNFPTVAMRHYIIRFKGKWATLFNLCLWCYVALLLNSSLVRSVQDESYLDCVAP